MNVVSEKVLAFFLPYLAQAVVAFLTEARVKAFLDKILDKLENSVVASENKYDDAAIIVLGALRAVLDIPDND